MSLFYGFLIKNRKFKLIKIQIKVFSLPTFSKPLEILEWPNFQNGYAVWAVCAVEAVIKNKFLKEFFIFSRAKQIKIWSFCEL